MLNALGCALSLAQELIVYKETDKEDLHLIRSKIKFQAGHSVESICLPKKSNHALVNMNVLDWSFAYEPEL